MQDQAIEEAEVDRLLEGIFHRYGHDFRGYARASVTRRVRVALTKSGCQTVAEMLERALQDQDYFNELISDLTVNVTEMFRDPEVYLALRKTVLPVLKTYPSVRIWHAGCATGEEVYSMCILLKEEGMLERARLYATDISSRALDHARAGVYAADQLQLSTANYQKAGGIEPFSLYYSAEGGSVKMDPALNENVVFARHNLATDEVFGEFHLILCRNVLIYFERDLQNRTLNLFKRSLIRRGFLCLGTKEALDFSPLNNAFAAVHKKQKIFRKI